MEPFEHCFTHKGVYLLPDGTRVVARWTTLGNDPRWWFIAEQAPAPNGVSEMLLVVYPNRSVYNFQPELERARVVLYHPQPSDLSIEDIRPLADEYQERRS